MDPKFSSNSARVKNREELNKILKKKISSKKINQWVSGLLKVNVPCGPINNIKKVFQDPQVLSRKMKISMAHRKSKKKNLDLIANPIKFSISKVKYRFSPPSLGQDTVKVLKNFLKMSKEKISYLKKKNII